MSKYECPFKVGDIVYHISNANIRMVVTDIDDDLETNTGYEGIECRWINLKGELQEEDFQPIELKMYLSTNSL